MMALLLFSSYSFLQRLNEVEDDEDTIEDAIYHLADGIMNGEIEYKEPDLIKSLQELTHVKCEMTLVESFYQLLLEESNW